MYVFESTTGISAKCKKPTKFTSRDFGELT